MQKEISHIAAQDFFWEFFLEEIKLIWLIIVSDNLQKFTLVCCWSFKD